MDRVKVSIEIPDPEPGEPPITRAQIDYLLDLLHDVGNTSITPAYIEGLRRRQASALIEQLIAIRDGKPHDTVRPDAPQASPRIDYSTWILIAAVLAGAVFLIRGCT